MFLATALGGGAASALGGGLIRKAMNPGAGKPKESAQQKAVNQTAKVISKKMPGPITASLVNLGIQSFFANPPAMGGGGPRGPPRGPPRRPQH